MGGFSAAHKIYSFFGLSHGSNRKYCRLKAQLSAHSAENTASARCGNIDGVKFCYCKISEFIEKHIEIIDTVRRAGKAGLTAVLGEIVQIVAHLLVSVGNNVHHNSAIG